MLAITGDTRGHVWIIAPRQGRNVFALQALSVLHGGAPHRVPESPGKIMHRAVTQLVSDFGDVETGLAKQLAGTGYTQLTMHGTWADIENLSEQTSEMR